MAARHSNGSLVPRDWSQAEKMPAEICRTKQFVTRPGWIPNRHRDRSGGIDVPRFQTCFVEKPFTPNTTAEVLPVKPDTRRVEYRLRDARGVSGSRLDGWSSKMFVWSAPSRVAYTPEGCATIGFRTNFRSHVRQKITGTGPTSAPNYPTLVRSRRCLRPLAAYAIALPRPRICALVLPAIPRPRVVESTSPRSNSKF